MTSAVFSDSWFRVADARVALLASTMVQKQEFGGKPWYVLRDTYSHRYFRIAPEAYAFLARLTPERTVEEIWLDFVKEHPEDAPGQEEVVRVLSQLHVANLLYFQEQPNTQAIFRRSQKQRQRELLGKLMAFLYWRIYLFDPDRLLNRCGRLIRIITSPAAFVIWMIVVFQGGVSALERWDALTDHSQGLFSLSNLPWLYLCLTVMKLLHETGHAFVCKRYGGQVHAFGVMFLILTPLPYVDMASTWAFKNRFHRALVGSAGMLVELFLAAIGALIWAQTGPGLINSLAFNVMVIGSVSSLLFNGNPLLRFDAYYILADLVDLPNLYQKAQQQWLYFADRYLLGTVSAESPSTNRREWLWFTGYGFLAFFYRLLITIGILVFVLDQWFVVGIVMVFITMATMVGIPVKKLWAHLSGPKVQSNRGRAQFAIASLVMLFLAGGAFIPLPYSIQAPGVLQAHQSSIIHTVTGGTLVRIAARNGAVLKKGDVIAEFKDAELEYEYALALHEARGTELQLRNAAHRAPADLVPIQRRIEAVNQQIRDLERLKQELIVRAPHMGEWVAPTLHELEGSWLAKGEVLGQLITGDQLRFSAVVLQEQADELFKYQYDGAKLRLTSHADQTINIREFVLIPHKRDRLSSSALGWAGGGEIPVKPGDQSGEVAAEPFFEIRATLPESAERSTKPIHGQSGFLHVPLPNQSLFWQLRKAFMQLFQKRYGISAARYSD